MQTHKGAVSKLGRDPAACSSTSYLSFNAADQATGLAGDVECVGKDGNLELVIEVKERELTLADVRSTILKARKHSLQEVLFSLPTTESKDSANINQAITNAWASGTNVYRLSISELIRVSLVLAGAAGRNKFLVNVGEQLNRYSTQPTNRKRWHQLLEEIQ